MKAMKTWLVAGACSALLFGCSGTTGETDGGAGDGGGDAGHVHDAGTDAGPSSCTVTADGGNGGANPCDSTQYCNLATGMCVKRCNAPSMPTMCGTDQACEPVSGTCIASCDAATNPTVCGATQACNPSNGLCETPCDDMVCLTNDELCVVDTNDCGTPTEATSCTYATTRNVPAASASGPIVFNATATDGNAADDTANCPGGGFAVWIQFNYVDTTGMDVTVADICSFMPANGSASLFVQYNDNMASGATGQPGCANNETQVSASTGGAGEIRVPLCFTANMRPANFVFQLKDAAGNTSNPVCLDIPAMQ